MTRETDDHAAAIRNIIDTIEEWDEEEWGPHIWLRGEDEPSVAGMMMRLQCHTDALAAERDALLQALAEAEARAERLACAFCDTLNAYDIPYEPEHFCIEESDIDVRRFKRDVYSGDLPSEGVNE